VPIPGTRKLHRLDENLGAIEVALDQDDLRDLDDVTSNFEVHGERGTGQERYA
jgi:aryl-alcohol dehydrogenase-like predicted oxidoreductase